MLFFRRSEQIVDQARNQSAGQLPENAFMPAEVSAIVQCQRAISLNPTFSIAFSVNLRRG